MYLFEYYQNIINKQDNVNFKTGNKIENNGAYIHFEYRFV